MISHYLSQTDYQSLLKLAEPRQYKRGEIIVHNGGWKSKPIFIVKQGLVAIYGSSTRAAHFVHMVYGPGELFPVSGFNTRPKDLSMQIGAKAETDTEVYVIPHEKFSTFMDVDPVRKQAVFNQVVDQFKLYTYRVENLEYTRARERIAYRMLLFASRFGKIEQSVLTIPRVSGKTVASAVSMSEEAVSREMARLKDLGIVSFSCGKVHLHDTEALKRQIGLDVRLPFRYPQRTHK